MNSYNPLLTTYDMGAEAFAFSSTRHGGFSEGNYWSFNVNEYCGDQESAVIKNRMALCRELNIKSDRLVMPHQIHSTLSRTITADFFKMSATEQRMYLEGVDALLTQEKDTCIGVSTADCVPLILYDAQKKLSAVIHAGWRGTQKEIVRSVLKTMKKEFCSSLSDVRAIIGPSICVEAFEVGNEVYEAFREVTPDIDRIARRIKGKWHIDLWEANRIQMETEGVPSENITVSSICNYSSSDMYFSARKLTVNSGRILTGIIIN